MKWDAYGKKRPVALSLRPKHKIKGLGHLLFIVVFLTRFNIAFSQPITFSLKNAPIEAAFKEIQTQSGYQFVFTTETLAGTRPVTLSVKSASILDVISGIFKDQELSFQIQDRYILVKKKKDEQGNIPSHEVSGVIIDEKGAPVPGASILVKGKNKATASDTNGNFVLENLDDNDVLVITTIGFRRLEFPLKGQHHVMIHMETYINTLDETVIIAYGTTTKRLNTGAVSTIKGDEILQQPTSNPLATIEGKIPGLFLHQNTGMPGSGFTMQLRGINSLRASGNAPLILVDGVPFPSESIASLGYIIQQGNPLGAISPSDIESIEVLKDADATAIYGSQGSNGVVLITTKKGKPGKMHLDLNLYTGVGTASHFMDLLNTPQYLTMRHEAFANDGRVPRVINYDVNGQWDTTRNTNWQKTLLGGRSHITDAQGSISAGDALTTFLLGGGLHRETTVLSGNFHHQKVFTNINLAHTSFDKKFKIEFSGNYTEESNRLPYRDPTWTALSLPPDAPSLYDSTGHLNWENSTWANPLGALLQNYKSNTDYLISHLLVEYEIIKGLQFKNSLGFSNIHMEEIGTNPLSAYDPALAPYVRPSSDFIHNTMKSWIIEPQINYQKSMGKGKLTLLLGSTFQQNASKLEDLHASGFASDALLENIRAATSLLAINADQSHYSYNAIFGRLHFDYREKFVFNLNGRRDGSSRFGSDRQFANFGSVGAGYVFSKEDFLLRSLPFLSYGKLRTSYGTTGSDHIGDYGYLDTYSPTPYPYQNGVGMVPTRIANPDYSWEVNKKFELGLELGFLMDRILLEGTYYHNRSSNQLVGYSLPSITGFTDVQFNLPAIVQNTGIEMNLQSTNIKIKNFQWKTSFNISIPRNQLIAYPNLAGSSYAFTYQEGKSLFIQPKLHYLGVDPATGIYQFQDLNKDGQISDPEDLQWLKQRSTDFYGGLQNSFAYRQWKLDVFFQFVKQTAYNYIAYFNLPGTASNQPVQVLNRWQKPGDMTGIEKFSQTFGPVRSAWANSSFNGDNSLGDASFVRIRSFSLSYELPERWLIKHFIKQARIYTQGQNLFTITRYVGLDPETQNAQVLPSLRLIVGGIQLSF